MSAAPELVAFVYFSYLACVAAVRGPARARRISVAALLVTTLISLALSRLAPPAEPPALLPTVLVQLWRLALLFAGYRVAGVFFDRPNLSLESRLLALDHRLVGRTSGRRRVWLAEGVEMAYVSVYVLIPAGALVVQATASVDAIDRFWTGVLAAGFVCYGALPWLQTRPPRAIEGGAVSDPSPAVVRRLNLAILARGSVGVNTLPSGHAATAIAVALSVWSVTPLGGTVFLTMALLIAMSTVVGRYHYLVDTALGLLVGAAAWILAGPRV